MTKDPVHILYLYQEKEDYIKIENLLSKIRTYSIELQGVGNFDEAKKKAIENFDLVLVDFTLGNKLGINLILELKALLPKAAVILLQDKNAAYQDSEVLQTGVSDYLIKDSFDHQDLDLKIRYAIRDSQLIEKLNHEAEKFSSIFERAGDSFIMIDSLGKIIEANSTFNQKFGISPHSLEESDHFFIDHIHAEEDKIEFLEKLGGIVDSYEFEHLLKISENKRFKGLTSIAKSSPSTYQVLIKDLTAIKAKEEEAFTLKKFASTGRIARLLAHEVKNPLTTIMLSSDQLKLELPENILEESGDLIEIINRNCNRINNLVSQLLNSTRFSALNPQKEDINTLVQEVLDQVQDRLELNKIRLIKNFDEDVCEIIVDKEKMKIALSNLIVNAVEAMEGRKGKLQVSTHSLKNGCRIEIKDNGIGISEENLERLFEPYFTDKENGTGLGLTNVQNIILSHSGSIRAESEAGKRTTFFIKLASSPKFGNAI